MNYEANKVNLPIPFLLMFQVGQERRTVGGGGGGKKGLQTEALSEYVIAYVKYGVCYV